MENVVLLHCSGSSGAQWRSLAARLQGYEVLAPDLVHRGTLGAEAAALSIAEPVHLVGHSYGGAVALHIARTRPDLLLSLTLIEPSAFHLLEEGEALREITAVAEEARAALAAGDYASGFGRFVHYWTGAATTVDSRAAFAQLAKVVLDFQALLTEPVRLHHVAGIDVPTLLVQGECTKLPSRSLCERLRTALPNASFRMVPQAGHMLPITHRDRVNELIAAHLEEKPCNRATPSASRYRSASAGRSTVT